MTDVKVINAPNAREDAYDLGYDEFEDADPIDGDEIAVHEPVDGLKEMALWANIIAPNLRAMAGFDDAGFGTYKQANQAVIVEEPDDEPADGLLWHSHGFHGELVDAFDSGAYDALEGRDRYHSFEW